MSKKSKQNKRKIKSKKTHKRYHQHGGKTVEEYKEEIEKETDVNKLDEIANEINKDANNDVMTNTKQLYELINAKKIEAKDTLNSEVTTQPVLQVTDLPVTDTAVTDKKNTDDEFVMAMKEEKAEENADAIVDQQDNKQVADEDTNFENKLSKIIADSENLLKNDPKYKAIIEQMKDPKNTEKLKEKQELIQTYNTNYPDKKSYVNPLSGYANTSTDTKNKLKSLGSFLFGKKSDKDKSSDKSGSNTTNDSSVPDYTQVQVATQLLNNNEKPIKLNSDQTAIIIPTNEVEKIKSCIKPILNCDFKEYDAEGIEIKSSPEPSAPPISSLVNNDAERNFNPNAK